MKPGEPSARKNGAVGYKKRPFAILRNPSGRIE